MIQTSIRNILSSFVSKIAYVAANYSQIVPMLLILVLDSMKTKFEEELEKRRGIDILKELVEELDFEKEKEAASAVFLKNLTLIF